METKLITAVSHLSPYWTALLDQLGISYCQADKKNIKTSPIIICNNVNEIKAIAIALKNGATVIDTDGSLTRLLGFIIKQRYVSYIRTTNIPFKFPVLDIDIYTNVHQCSKAEYANNTVGIFKVGTGTLIFLGIPIANLLQDIRYTDKQMVAKTPRLPHELQPKISKGELSQFFFHLIKYAFVKQNLPFVHKWFFPHNAQNIFLFRIDSDEANQTQVDKWYHISKEYGMRYTWFLHTKAHEQWLNYFTSLTDHETAVHCYEHCTSFNQRWLQADINKACKLLKKNNLSTNGYASPYGIWSKQLNEVCTKIKFNYTSDFTFCTDSLPIRPINDNILSPFFQIPIHPICIGSLIKAKMNKEEMIDYYTTIIKQKKALLTPIILYDHLLHPYADLLKTIFSIIKSYGIKNITFSEYIQFWKIRESVKFTPMVVQNNVVINKGSDVSSITFAIWKDELSSILQTDDTSSTISETVKYRPNDASFDINLLKRKRKKTLRMFKDTILAAHHRKKF